MLVLGAETIFVSHLPMFVPQHRYQAIWQVSFGEEADKKYRAERARAENADRIFTLAPKELFRLPELTTSRTSFPADVFVGHFERQGKRLLLEGITVTVKSQIHFHPFVAADRRPESLAYLLFGDPHEMFLAHRISVAPNYDQVLAVKPSKSLARVPKDGQFVVPGRGDGRALRAGEVISGSIEAQDEGDAQPSRTPVELQVIRQIYLEEGELRDNELVIRR
jgi:hypothetical protein